MRELRLRGKIRRCRLVISGSISKNIGNRLRVRAVIAPQSQDLVRRGIATGGMQAKLTAAGEALRNGIRQVVIASGAAENVLARLLASEVVGTRLVRES